MLEVKFYETVKDEWLKFAVIITVYDGKWIFCKHKNRSTLEVPGGHREAGEDILDTAKRELYEETGAIRFEIKPVCVYSVTAPWNFNGKETFGMLYFAEVEELEGELHSEIRIHCHNGSASQRLDLPGYSAKINGRGNKEDENWKIEKKRSFSYGFLKSPKRTN